ncbi:hypothetical protein CBR_g56858 [Chara braunii]|uniref:NADP-dependent oxidoreductase domain-containing protein n=1 Tax=Chara braunii TaxID=69332 RepID=A0A388ME15_CHABU|nr:hypothetical protein CBR_g56858 [Chara braunii]|eukprot:GBG92719.1 hypothetical protein CBR_g56858 [Chara braunii]
MGMSMFYGPPKPEDEMVALIRRAVDLGVSFFDTSDLYGPHTNELLLGKALAPVREKVEIATSCGVKVCPEKDYVADGSPAHVRKAVEGSLERLQTSYIDLLFLQRVDSKFPIEVTMGEMKKLVEEGKAKYLGLCEACPGTIRRAHAVHPLTAVMVEWSLWERNGVEPDVVPLCRELGIGIVSYSPLGKGFFVGKGILDQFEEGDFRLTDPRFVNLDANRVFYDRVKALADAKGVKPGQLELAWVHHRGEDVFPIPGTTKVEHLEENIQSLAIALSQEELQALEAAVPNEEVVGDRYHCKHYAMTWDRHPELTPPLHTYTEDCPHVDHEE